MISIGFDASTSTVGYAYTEDGKILHASFVDISKIEGNRQKAWTVIDVIKSNPLTEKVGRVNLEGSLSGFSGPANRAVVVKLAKWSAVFEYVLEDFFGKPISVVNVCSARKHAFGISRIKGVDPKTFVKEQVEKKYDLSPWNVYNKMGNLDKRMEDIRDALVISLYNK